jgi:O-antigen/teichoic acid export membrane protein
MLIPTIVSSVFSYVLIANGLEKFTLAEVSIATTLGALSSIILIPIYEILGAALSSLVMSLSSLAILIYAMNKKLFSINLWNVINLPLTISSLMLMVLLILKQINMNFLYVILISTGAYLLIVFVISVREFGGIEQIRQKIKNR